ncbi:abortive phage infection protein [Aequorivita soesokkakensis]|uniref:Abortive phage infection protein n=1 Tax=Aequorivita soesokkakensis TaxID=1385699 RepID=A0A1A9LG96_9FLAO|nr:CPBP family intramembrane glutamic endopeptidase [Aequorivita soesokkakensis]OAD91936.1 abortive phage infection protein [Aequorivita soesokkakensis]
MYIKQAFKSLHEWWRYLVGFLIIFIASQIGSIPLLIAVMFKVMSNGGNIESIQDPNVMMTVLDSNLTLFLMLLSFAIGLLAIYLVVKYLHRQTFVQLTTSRKKTDWGRVFFGFGLITVTTLVVTTLDYYNNPQDYVLQFDLVPFLILAVIAIIMIPLQTSFEEYLFRGYLMQGIGVLAKNKWLPLIITSVVFGALHLANPEVDKFGNIIMVYYIGTGFFLGIMTLMDEGMELALGFHAGNNLITALLVTADWTVFKTNSVFKDISEPSAGFDVIAPVLILYPIFLLIMAWRYKWRDWSGKLFGKVEEPIVLTEEKTSNPTFIE